MVPLYAARVQDLALQLRLARQLIVADVLARFVQLQRLEIPGIGETRQQLQVDQRAVAPAHERSATVVLGPDDVAVFKCGPCGHTAELPPSALLRGLGLQPTT